MRFGGCGRALGLSGGTGAFRLVSGNLYSAAGTAGPDKCDDGKLAGPGFTMRTADGREGGTFQDRSRSLIGELSRLFRMSDTAARGLWSSYSSELQKSVSTAGDAEEIRYVRVVVTALLWSVAVAFLGSQRHSSRWLLLLVFVRIVFHIPLIVKSGGRFPRERVAHGIRARLEVRHVRQLSAGQPWWLVLPQIPRARWIGSHRVGGVRMCHRCPCRGFGVGAAGDVAGGTVVSVQAGCSVHVNFSGRVSEKEGW